MEVHHIDITDVIVGRRFRQRPGRLDKLVASLRTLGLLHPIVVDGGHRLVAGWRRLEAAKVLGWKSIPCHVCHTVDDALAAIQAERDENTVREGFTPMEIAEIATAIREIEGPKARERQRSGLKQGAKVSRGGNLPRREKPEDNRKTDEKIAETVSQSPRTVRKIETVAKAAQQDPKRFGPAAREMERTGKVDPAYQAVRQRNGRPRGASPPDVPPALLESVCRDLAARAAKVRTFAETPAGQYLNLQSIERHFTALDRLLRAQPAKRAAVEVGDVEFPPALDTPACRAALEQWFAHKRRRRESYKDGKQVGLLLKRLAGIGPEAFVDAVEHSIAQNYQGIHPVRNGSARQHRDRTAEARKGVEAMKKARMQREASQ